MQKCLVLGWGRETRETARRGLWFSGVGRSDWPAVVDAPQIVAGKAAGKPTAAAPVEQPLLDDTLRPLPSTGQ